MRGSPAVRVEQGNGYGAHDLEAEKEVKLLRKMAVDAVMGYLTTGTG